MFKLAVLSCALLLVAAENNGNVPRNDGKGRHGKDGKNNKGRHGKDNKNRKDHREWRHREKHAPDAVVASFYHDHGDCGNAPYVVNTYEHVCQALPPVDLLQRNYDERAMRRLNNQGKDHHERDLKSYGYFAVDCKDRDVNDYTYSEHAGKWDEKVSGGKFRICKDSHCKDCIQADEWFAPLTCVNVKWGQYPGGTFYHGFSSAKFGCYAKTKEFEKDEGKQKYLKREEHKKERKDKKKERKSASSQYDDSSSSSSSDSNNDSSSSDSFSSEDFSFSSM